MCMLKTSKHFHTVSAGEGKTSTDLPDTQVWETNEADISNERLVEPFASFFGTVVFY